MIGQLKICDNGSIKDKVQKAIDFLRYFEPAEGYFVAFSGGKDSQTVYHLCKMAGVKFDAHYSVTSVDPPELIYFIREHYPDVAMDIPHDDEGKRVSMWSLIEKKHMPPTRIVRYCCEELKECSGKGRVTVTGIRWAESTNRRMNQGLITFDGKPNGTKKIAEELDLQYRENKHGAIILNNDNEESREMVERCFRNRKTLINPIIDWDDDDVWEFLNGNGIPHCRLYDEGSRRIGCIGCPMGGGERMNQAMEKYPKYRNLYLKAFRRMIKINDEMGIEQTWKTPEQVMSW
jgi:phosphoadenosine phosphosulfate reductase